MQYPDNYALFLAAFIEAMRKHAEDNRHAYMCLAMDAFNVGDCSVVMPFTWEEISKDLLTAFPLYEEMSECTSFLDKAILSTEKAEGHAFAELADRAYPHPRLPNKYRLEWLEDQLKQVQSNEC